MSKHVSFEHVLEPYPLDSLLPKRGINADKFTALYPEYDGRDVVIAILDTGVDPFAAGMQTTTTGERKLIDIIDTTGSGDVDTSKIVAAKDGVIEGLSGRKLKIPDDWSNTSGEYRIGIKPLFDFFPQNLKKRITQQRREKLWDSQNNTSLAEVKERISKFDKSLDNKILENLEALYKVLDESSSKFPDLGPVCDIVVWEDDWLWRVCIDTSFCGELSTCKVVSPYKDSFDVAFFGDEDMLSYTINVYDNGDVLSVVTTSGSHGTHVAAIAAANFPDEPARNGIAPGAQLVSIKIGDSRLSSMETGTSLVRAIDYCCRNKVDLINLSFGEASKWNNTGVIADAIKTCVSKYNVCFVSSASNDGPSLSSLGSPGGTVDHVIGVGAYYMPEMMTAQYSCIDKQPLSFYHWSSRSPSRDGYQGISISAPGGAITSVPNWTLKHGRLMNGTSMASPNACGGIALIISGLKSLDVPYSPFSIKRVIENTAYRSSEFSTLTQGNGLLKVDAAFDYFKNETDILDNVSFKVSTNLTLSNRGIFVHESSRLARLFSVSVTIDPVFTESTSNRAKIEFSLHLSLCSTESWVRVPASFDLQSDERAFTVDLDPRGLSPGNHYAEILGFASNRTSLGPLFRCPVTVVKPDVCVNNRFDCPMRLYKPCRTFRQFIEVPSNVTSAEITFHSGGLTESRQKLMVFCAQWRPELTHRENTVSRYVSIFPDHSQRFSFKVIPGLMLQVTIARSLMSSKLVEASWSIVFTGLMPNSRTFTMMSSEPPFRIEATATTNPQDIQPFVSMKYSSTSYRPSESKISPLSSSRDISIDGRHSYQLELTYNFSHSGKSVEVTPSCPLLNDLLYESNYQSQLWMLCTSSKQVIGYGDYCAQKYSYVIDKGDYVVRFQIRSYSNDALETIKDIPLVLQTKLQAPVTLDVYRYPTLQSKITSVFCPAGITIPFYIATVNDEKLPKTVNTGAYLSGNVSFCRDSSARVWDCYPFYYVVCSKSKKESSDVNKSSKEKAENTLSMAIRDAKIAFIQSDHTLSEEDCLQLYEDLKKDAHSHIPLHQAYLNFLEKDTRRGASLHNIRDLCSELLTIFDTSEVLLYFAVKPDSRNESIKSEMEKKRNFIIDVQIKRLLATLDIFEKEHVCEPEDAIVSQWKELQKWVDVSESKYLKVYIGYHLYKENYGFALKALQKQYEDNTNKENLLKISMVFDQLGYAHIVDRIRNSLVFIRFPLRYPLF